MIKTAKEAKNWYYAHSFNQDEYDMFDKKVGITYILACIISEELKLEINDKISGIYLGSNLAVNVSNSGETSYYLVYYSGNYDALLKNQYKIGFNTYQIVDYSVDYKKYIKSKDFIPLTDLKINNILLDYVNFYQAYKYTSDKYVNMGSFGVEIETINNDSGKIINTIPKIATYNDQVINNFATKNTIIMDKSYFNNLLSNQRSKSKFNSRTPSTWHFGYSLMVKLNSTKNTKK